VVHKIIGGGGPEEKYGGKNEKPKKKNEMFPPKRPLKPVKQQQEGWGNCDRRRPKPPRDQVGFKIVQGSTALETRPDGRGTPARHRHWSKGKCAGKGKNKPPRTLAKRGVKKQATAKCRGGPDRTHNAKTPWSWKGKWADDRAKSEGNREKGTGRV